eukprot:symbB.v1.2.009631.t1/scaffold612.1/size204580/4
MIRSRFGTQSVLFEDRQQRVFLPVGPPPPPLRKLNKASMLSAETIKEHDVRQNAGAQRLLKALSPPSRFNYLDASKVMQDVEVNALQACFPQCKKETGVSNKDNATCHSVAMAWVGFKDTARWDDYNAAWYMEQFTHSIAPAAAETLDLKTLPPPGRASGHLMIVAKAGQGEFCMEVSGNTYVLRSRMEELEVGGPDLSEKLKAEEVDLTKETYVQLVKLSVELKNLRAAGRFYGDMEAKGFQPDEEMTDQVIALYATSAP